MNIVDVILTLTSIHKSELDWFATHGNIRVGATNGSRREEKWDSNLRRVKGADHPVLKDTKLHPKRKTVIHLVSSRDIVRSPAYAINASLSCISILLNYTLPNRSLCRNLRLWLCLRTCVILLAGQNQLLRLILILLQLCKAVHILARCTTLILAIDERHAVPTSSPHLVLENTLLTFRMLERTEGLGARVVPATDLRMCELATWNITICSIPTWRHVRMSERTIRIGAIGEELAVDFLLEMLRSLRWRWMSTNAFSVFTCGTKGAGVRHINRLAGWCSRRLMCIRAVRVGAIGVKSAYSLERFFLVAF